MKKANRVDKRVKTFNAKIKIHWVKLMENKFFISQGKKGFR